MTILKQHNNFPRVFQSERGDAPGVRHNDTYMQIGIEDVEANALVLRNKLALDYHIVLYINIHQEISLSQCHASFVLTMGAVLDRVSDPRREYYYV